MDIQTRIALETETRMTWWWPKVETVDVPKPRTIIIPADSLDILSLVEPEWEGDPRKMLDAVERAAEEIGYPLFLRTDLVSGKHRWKESCYVASRKHLETCLYGVIEANILADVNPKAVVVREYIPMKAAFTAFSGEMPVAKERRYFIRDGKVVCHHPYWPEDAIRFMPGKEPEGWREKLAQFNRETPEEIGLLIKYASKLAEVLSGYWSVDFAYGHDGVWYFIDAARGELSWHPPCSKGEISW
jgi:hypothetical protein